MKKITYGKNLNTLLIIENYALQPYLSPYTDGTIKKKIQIILNRKNRTRPFILSEKNKNSLTFSLNFQAIGPPKIFWTNFLESASKTDFMLKKIGRGQCKLNNS